MDDEEFYNYQLTRAHEEGYSLYEHELLTKIEQKLGELHDDESLLWWGKFLLFCFPDYVQQKAEQTENKLPDDSPY